MQAKKFKNVKKLNLGAGHMRLPGFTKVDLDASRNPDIIHNLNDMPYPFESNSVEYVEMSHIIEHLDEPLKVLKELHRIMR